MVNIKILESLKPGGPKRNVFESDHEQNPFVPNNTNDFMGEAAYSILIRLSSDVPRAAVSTRDAEFQPRSM
jgi:hypothetical protein